MLKYILICVKKLHSGMVYSKQHHVIVCQWLAASRLFSPVSPTNKTDRHDITEILLKVTLNTISPPEKKLCHLYWNEKVRLNKCIDWTFELRFGNSMHLFLSRLRSIISLVYGKVAYYFSVPQPTSNVILYNNKSLFCPSVCCMFALLYINPTLKIRK